MKKMLIKTSLFALLGTACLMGNPIQAMEEQQESSATRILPFSPLTPEQVEAAFRGHGLPLTAEEKEAFPSLISCHFANPEKTKRDAVHWHLTSLEVPEGMTAEQLTAIKLGGTFPGRNKQTCFFGLGFDGELLEDANAKPEKTGTVLFDAHLQLSDEQRESLQTKKTQTQIEKEFNDSIIGGLQRSIATLQLAEKEERLVIVWRDSVLERWTLIGLNNVPAGKSANDVQRVELRDTKEESFGTFYYYELDFGGGMLNDPKTSAIAMFLKKNK